MKRSFYKVRVIHDPVKECSVVETKEAWFRIWVVDNFFFYGNMQNPKNFNESSAREAALARARQISSRYIIGEF